jgi:hypothetical protein
MCCPWVCRLARLVIVLTADDGGPVLVVTTLDGDYLATLRPAAC